ncbi:MBL fold metallo-hydrolase [Paenibacillus flagellatus]|uniref:MBL fold metallo-hydrolase n=1 Tax=Paenibacillus flagellatus TaxID=2211139 RepID=A0A2V5KR67_9BACL|nr:MBL fold metallo-hydrolase [Paenibacillus flagellatus]PYI51296.1 MBL fold metallo-hydrolase [Paenibacillus flagellatus]
MSLMRNVYREGESLARQIESTRVPDGMLAVWHLGQESVAVKGGGVIGYFDPYLTDSVAEADPDGPWKRAFPSPLPPERITHADYVWISHNHGDHLDPATLAGIYRASPRVVFVCPAPLAGILKEIGIPEDRIVTVKGGETIRLGELSVDVIPCKHEEFDRDADGNYPYVGYVVRWNGVVFYHAGDTILYPGLAETLRTHRIDIACLPINGADLKRREAGIVGNMGFREAADLAAAIEADLAIPFHYDLFPFNADNPSYFVDYVVREYPYQKFKLMRVGERLLYASEKA